MANLSHPSDFTKLLGLNMSIRVVWETYLKRPRLERDTFSGGTNESAKARNKTRVEEASRWYILNGDPKTLILPAWRRLEWEPQLRKLGVVP